MKIKLSTKDADCGVYKKAETVRPTAHFFRTLIKLLRIFFP